MTAVFKTRWEFIEPFVRGKVVLDIGPAELIGTVNREKEGHSIHKRLVAAAQEVIGLEKNAEQVLALRELGYNIREGDAQAFDLGQLFDVVMAGELIEHLSNPGTFLDCARRHLKPEGTLLLTTPNRFDAAVFLSSLLRDSIPSYNKPIAKHVAYYDENCLKDLLSRHGFSRLTWANYEWVGRPSPNLTMALMCVVLRGLRPRFLAGVMVAAQP